MATIPHQESPGSQPPEIPAASGVFPSDHLKLVPELRTDRERIRAAAKETALGLDKSRPLSRGDLESYARKLLARLGLPEGYAGWTMVILGTAFWRDQIVTVPIGRRLLLLPHCLRSNASCEAEYDELGLLCQGCGACELTELRDLAVKKGYRVLIAEGSPIVLKIILEGHIDAVLGVACLNSLEKALDKILMVGLPSMAVPLLKCTCRDTSTDFDWVRDMIETPYRPGLVRTRTYVHLLRGAAGMFRPDSFEALVPRVRSGSSLVGANGHGLGDLDPLASTEAIAFDFLLKGGKHLRPFITLATYDAMTGGHGVGPDGGRSVEQLSGSLKRIAVSMEVFHKASLVHDDVEDDDPFRYGHPTLHRKYGTPAAINVGDYLIGLGYRLIAAERQALGAEVVADVLMRLSEAHTRLCEGQGAELAWRETPSMRLAPLDALKIYALKTAPAFEAALFAGLRLAGPAEAYRDLVVRFARHLGVAFQIVNDLDDWQATQPNKRTTGRDVLARRPTVLWALALDRLPAPARRDLESLVADEASERKATLQRVRKLYQQGGVYETAARLVIKHRRRALEATEGVEPAELAYLLRYFVDTILPANERALRERV